MALRLATGLTAIAAAACVSGCATLGSRFFGSEWTDASQITYGLDLNLPRAHIGYDKNIPNLDFAWSRTDTDRGDGEMLSTFCIGLSYWRRSSVKWRFLCFRGGLELGEIESRRLGATQQEDYAGVYAGIGVIWHRYAVELRGTFAPGPTLHGVELDPGGVQILLSFGYVFPPN